MNDQKYDEGAITAIFNQFSPALYKYSLRSCHDPIVAENIVADVFGQLVEQLTTGKAPIKNLRTYLYTIAYQLLLNHSRANPQNALFELTLFGHADEQFAPTSLGTKEQVEMQALISAFNTELTYEQRHVIVLRFLEDFSLKETAEIISEKVNSIKVIQSGGIAKLRKVMGFDKDWGYSPIESHDDHLDLPSKATIDTMSSILPSTLTNVAPLLAGRKRETAEENKPKEARLYVGNLPYGTDAANLIKLFSLAGQVRSAQVFKDSESRWPTSFASIVMSTQEEAIRAMYMFHRRNFDGRSLAVKIGEKEQEDDLDDLPSAALELEKRRLRVFLCHSHKDAVAVKAIYKRLKNRNIDAWLDKENLLPGSDWEYEIRKAVRTSDIVIVCLSKAFDQKGFRQKEVRIALEESGLQPEGEIFIIPARLEECEILPSLRHLHWVNLFESDGYEKLMRTFKVRAQKIGAVL